jgi:hypothetical protein
VTVCTPAKSQITPLEFVKRDYVHGRITLQPFERIVEDLILFGYRPGARLWVKTKNRDTARFQEELAAAQRRRH